MKNYNIKHMRKLFDADESCYICTGKEAIECTKQDFTGMKIDRQAIKMFIKLHLGVDCNSWKYMPTKTGQILLECC